MNPCLRAGPNKQAAFRHSVEVVKKNFQSLWIDAQAGLLCQGLALTEQLFSARHQAQPSVLYLPKVPSTANARPHSLCLAEADLSVVNLVGFRDTWENWRGTLLGICEGIPEMIY